MERIAGDEKRGRYQAAIAPQPEGKLVRFRIQALDMTGTARIQPSENDPRPTYSYSTVKEANPARIPFVYLVQAGPAEKGPGRLSTRRSNEAPATRGNSALLHVPPEGGPVELFDHVRITSRHGGFKVRFNRDQPFRGMTVANFLFEGPSRWTLSEPLSYHLYRLSGVPAPLAEHARVWRDGRPLGYHLVVEQPNRSFLKRNRRGASGRLYKAVWFGKGIVGQHEKKTNRAGGHEDLLQLIDGLIQGSSEERWKFIEEHFNVEEAVGYFAVSMCISDWDGFHNNYFLHHRPGRTGKWEIYPWDKDKTWGDYDGASPQYDWYEMPLTVGMEGDRSPPLDPRSKANNEPGAFGGLSWWRKGGHLSRPLLANPTFRKAFLVRLHDLCATVFTEEKLLPFIETLERDLAPEVEFRAEVKRRDAHEALRAFKGDLESLKNQVKHRREFILSELEKAGVSRRL